MNSNAGQEESFFSDYVNVPDGKLYYETAGSGDETVVLIHDGLVHSAVWDNQFTTFAEKYRVVRYDRRGYGRSPKPEKKYSNISDLDAVFTSLKIDKAIVMGMSSGGALTIDFTLAHPEKVSALVLVGAVVGGFGYSDHMQTRGGRIDASYYADPQKLLHYIVKEDPYEIAPQNTAVREKVWQLLQATIQEADLSSGRLAVPPQRKGVDGLAEITVPALIVLGEFDIPDVFVHAGVIESGMPSAQKVIIRNAGHLVPMEQPEAFNTQVFSFLNSTEFFQTLNSQGVFAAVELFNKKHGEDKNWIPFSETRMNILGYQYLRGGKKKEAIELFKLNVAAYPEAANTYDSLGEAYMVNGDTELAIQNYEKSLELNPDNKNAVDKLKQLK